MTDFEHGLWQRLVEAHDADRVSISAPRPRHARRPLIIGAGVTGLAAVTAAAVVGIGAATSAPAAYALTPNADGTVTVTINDVANSVTAVNAKFAAMGIDTTVVPVQSSCPDTGNLDDQLMLAPGSSVSDSLTFRPGAVQPGYTGVIAAEQLADGQVAMTEEAIKPPIPTCFPTTAYTMVKIGDKHGTPAYRIKLATPSTTASQPTTTTP